MRPAPNLLLAILAVLAAAPLACRKEEKAQQPLPPLPGEKGMGAGAGGGALPEGHPPIDASAAPKAAALDPKKVESPTGLRFDIPEGWKRLAPKSQMRVAELVPPRAEGATKDGLLIVSFFAGGAGGFEQNVDRWVSQMKGPGGESLTRDKAQIRELDLGHGLKARIVEAEGTYAESNMFSGESATLENAKMIAAQVDGADGSFFFKFAGPAATVLASKAGYEAILKSVKLGA